MVLNRFKFRWPFLLLVFTAAVFLIVIQANLAPKGPASPAGGSEDRPAATLKIGEKIIKVEIASDEKSRAKGLSGRSGLSKNEGLLMVFEKPDKYGIWMKDMKFPIDIFWIRKERVITIQKNAEVPAPETPENMLVVYNPREEADMILEVAAGFADENGIKSGDSAEFYNSE